MSGIVLQRLGMVMEPEPGNPQEVEGVLNPAAARGPDGHLYLFPRLVARGIIRASAWRGWSSIRPVIPSVSSGLESLWSRKPIMSAGRAAAVDAKILESRLSSRSSVT